MVYEVEVKLLMEWDDQEDVPEEFDNDEDRESYILQKISERSGYDVFDMEITELKKVE